MSWSVTDIQTNIAIELDQSATPPTVGGTDWTIRLNAINRSLRDWAETYDWEALHKIHNGIISTSTGNASYALPTDFKKMDGYVSIVADGSTTYEFPHENATKNILYNESDKYVNILGNESSGHVMYIHSNTLASGASVSFTYYASAATLSSESQVAEIPDATYLVQRSLYYLYKGREDGRFPEAKVEADRIMARMIENENVKGWGSTERRVSKYQHPFKNWRIGRD
jgi:hypothetical protein